MFLRLAMPALILAGCAVEMAPSAGAPDCVALFQRYDRTKATMSTPSGAADRMPIPPALQPAVQALNEAHCLTRSDSLDLTADAAPVVDGGAAIAPTRLHAGVVTSQSDEAAVLAFFAAHGVPARSIGAAGLGRRIYLGPFATEAALDGAASLAAAAGFAAVYRVDQ